MRRSLALLLLSATGTVTSAALGEDSGDLAALLQDPVVSTASFGSTTLSTAPATSTSISAEELRTHGIRSLDEAINYASLGMVTIPNMHAVEVGTRGVLLNGDYGSHVLVLVNGLTLNEAWSGTGYVERGAGIPFELIDHIEVMLGPGSVMYGSQAMLGVINIVTKRAKDFEGVRVITEGEWASPLGIRYQVRGPGSKGYFSDLGKGYRLGLGYGKPFELFDHPAEVVLELEHYAFDGASIRFRDQDYGADAVTGEPKRFGPGPGTGTWGGEATRSWYTQAPTGYARLVWGDVTLSTRVGSYRRSAPYNDGLVRYAGDFDPSSDSESDTHLDLELVYQRPVSSYVTLTSRLYFERNLYRWYLGSSAAEDCDEGQLSGCRNEATGRARRYGVELQGAVSWHDPLNMSTTLGADGQIRDVFAQTMIRSQDGDTGPYGRMDPVDSQGAVFLEHLVRPLATLDLNLGARYDADERFGSQLSPRAAAVWSAWPDASWKVIYASAFRAPSAYELYYADPLVEPPAPNLGAETTRTVEASFEQRLGAHRVFVGVFRSWWDDLVSLQTLTPEETQAHIDSGALNPQTVDAVQYRNIGGVNNYGINAAYGLAFLNRSLRFDVSVTAARSTMHGTGGSDGDLTVSPQVFGNARASYDLPDDLPTLGLAMTFRGRQLADRYYDGGFSDPPVAKGSWELRGTVSGPLLHQPTINYRVSTTYNRARVAPYAIGAVQYAWDETTRTDLQPVNRLYGFAGLEYVFDP